MHFGFDCNYSVLFFVKPSQTATDKGNNSRLENWMRIDWLFFIISVCLQFKWDTTKRHSCTHARPRWARIHTNARSRSTFSESQKKKLMYASRQLSLSSAIAGRPAQCSRNFCISEYSVPSAHTHSQSTPGFVLFIWIVAFPAVTTQMHQIYAIFFPVLCDVSIRLVPVAHVACIGRRLSSLRPCVFHFFTLFFRFRYISCFVRAFYVLSVST